MSDGRRATRTSFQPGISGNPGGRPSASAEVSALARRYTPDWVRGLVEVARQPVNRHTASSVVSACLALRDTGYPGLAKAQPEVGPTSVHLHLLAVTGEASAVLTEQVVSTLEGEWGEGGDEAPIDERMVPRPDARLPHEALPLWDAADEAQEPS